MKRPKHLVVRWVHGVLCALSGYELLQLGPVRLIELSSQNWVPVGTSCHTRNVEESKKPKPAESER